MLKKIQKTPLLIGLFFIFYISTTSANVSVNISTPPFALNSIYLFPIEDIINTKVFIANSTSKEIKNIHCQLYTTNEIAVSDSHICKVYLGKIILTLSKKNVKNIISYYKKNPPKDEFNISPLYLNVYGVYKKNKFLLKSQLKFVFINYKPIIYLAALLESNQQKYCIVIAHDRQHRYLSAHFTPKQGRLDLGESVFSWLNNYKIPDIFSADILKKLAKNGMVLFSYHFESKKSWENCLVYINNGSSMSFAKAIAMPEKDIAIKVTSILQDKISDINNIFKENL